MCNLTTRIATCACDQLSVRCLGEPTNVSLCHCLACQKRTGSTYGVAAFFWRKDVEPQGATRSYARQSRQRVPNHVPFLPRLRFNGLLGA